MRCLVGKKRLHLLLASAALLALGVAGVGPVNAQVLYGSIVGNVSDSTNAAVPGATVTITHQETNLSREARTNNEGTYRFINVQPGDYTVKVSVTGFKESVKQNVPVTPNTISRVDIGLEVGQLAEAVTVQSERALLQTDKADLHTEVSGKELVRMPLGSYRNYQSIINLVPGATPARFQNAITDTPARALTTNVNGTNRNSNNTRLDGTTNIFIWLPHHSVYVAPSETIETVNVTTNAFDAEQGMAGGAAVTVVTKSGTNEFRGSMFEFHEREELNARNYFLARKADGSPGDKPNSSRNIFGGTLGGPVIKNKLFFFAGFEGTYERGVRTRTGTVPTDAMRRGDFSGLNVTLYDPATGTDGFGRAPFAGNVIPGNRISPIAQTLIALLPAPTRAGTSGNFTRTGIQKLDRNNYDFKLNFNRSASHQIWAKYSMMNALVTQDFFLGEAGGPSIGDGGSGVGDVDVYIASVGHTWTLSSNLVLDGVVGFTDHNQTVTGPDFGQNFGLEVLGIPGTNGPDPRQGGMPQFAITGFTTLGNEENWSPIFRDERTYTVNSNLTYLRDKHELKFGFDIVRMELDHWQPEIGAGPRGRFNFTGGATALRGGTQAPGQFNAFADFLLGLPMTMEKSLQFEEMSGREWQLAFYLRDRWQVTRNLTVSAGLRFERYPLMTRKDRGIEVYDPNTNKVLIGGRGSNPQDLGIKVKYPFVVPRLGIAWRLNENSVLRAGYGMTISPLPFSRPLRGFYPLTIAQSFENPVNNQFLPFQPLAQGIPAFTGPDLSTGIVDIPGTVEMRTPYADHVNRGYIQSWNLTYERKLPWDIAAAVSYVGTQTTHQLADLNINAAGPGEGNAGRPLAKKFGRIATTRQWDGWLSANYHALQVALNRPFTKGVFVKGAYTWSKAMNWTDDDGWADLQWNHPSVLGRDYARAGYDLPHILQLGAGVDLPFGKDSKSILGAIVKNWQITGVASAYSGRPFFLQQNPQGAVNAPGNRQTPDQVKDVEKLGGIGPGKPYYDPTAFRPVTEVRFGNVGRNTLRLPAVRNLTMSLFRRFPIKGRINLEARLEAFNVTNTPHFTDPGYIDNNVVSSGFLTITRADPDERQIRLGLRLAF